MITPSKTQNKIDQILMQVTDEAESANYHDFCGLAEGLFETLKDLIPQALHLKAAKLIAEEIRCSF